MAVNFLYDKNKGIPFTAPAGGVVSGVPVLIGAILVVPLHSANAGEQFTGMHSHVFSLPKAAGAIAEGAIVYWDNAAKNVTTTVGSNTRIGFAGFGGAASGDANCPVVLNGTV